MDRLRENGLMKLWISFWICGTVLICHSFGEKPEVIFKSITCDYSNLSAVIVFEDDFNGVVFAEGNFFNPECKISGTGSIEMSLSMSLRNCGNLVRQRDDDIYVSNSIVVQYHPVIQSDSDSIHMLTCKLPPNMEHTQEFIHEYHPTRFLNEEFDAYMDFKVGEDVLGVDISNKLMVGEEFVMFTHIKDSGKHKDYRFENCWAFEGETIETSRYVVQIHDIRKCNSNRITNVNLSKGAESRLGSTLYGTVKAFKFPASNAVHITCSIVACTETCYRCNSSLIDKFYNVIIRDKRSSDDKFLRGRNRYMKSTIKVLGAKLIEKNSELSENDVNFRRRVANDEIAASKKYQGHENLRPIEKVRNEIYSFNLSNSVAVFTDNEFHFRHPLNTLSSTIPTDCVPKWRFGLITAVLSFVMFCLIIMCIGFILHIRKEKKKNQTDTLLLYNVY